MKFNIKDASKIRLVIWDLDETFWKGTLSDNDMTLDPVKMNLDLVKRFAYRGIINSICSKNDKDIAEQKLQELGVGDFFVFNSINWDPKGPRIQNIINEMALRPVNVLFLDDNPSNLAEAEFIVPDLMVAGPEVIPELYTLSDQLGKDDSVLSRLKQYRVLEKKKKEEKNFKSNIDFLRQSNIRIQISHLDEEMIPRTVELIQRSNQLNFTKKRIGEDEIHQLLGNIQYDLGCVIADDDYGKYGLVGFYALDKQNNRLEHFLFSCRTIGMGIEQYVYAVLGYPELTITGPVSGSVSKEGGMPDYITQVDNLDSKQEEKNRERKISVLLKGPCDLEVMASYLEGGEVSLDKEFNFIDFNGNQADYYNHMINILNCNNSFTDELCQRYSFLTKEGFTTGLFSGKYDVVCLSLLMDATLAVYADTQDHKLAYGIYSKPLSDRNNHQMYLDKQVMTARSNFVKTELEDFSEKFQQVEYPPEDIASNIEKIIERIWKVNSDTKIVILLLSELEYQTNNSMYLDFFAEKHLVHRKINDQIRQRFCRECSVYLLDVNKYISSQSDYFDNINHYSKYVYYKIAKEFADFIEAQENVEIKTSSKIKALYQNLRRMVYKKIFVR